jgi:polar amino acid transport system substrate-binding protein
MDELKRLRKENRYLKRELSRLRRISYRDELTGLWNKMGFKREVISILSMVRRQKSSLCLGVFDLDGFKDVNDRLGHKEGDKVLVLFAEVLKKYTRLGDILGRWGGDEFLIALPLAKLEDALNVGERIREYVEKRYRRSKYPITVSGAFSEVSFSSSRKRMGYSDFERLYEKLFKEADEKLLKMAKQRKNKVI